MPTLTLDEFLPKARELNPDYSDDELIQAYQDRYGTRPTQTVSSAPLMTLNEFLPKARKLNPAYSDEELTAAWQEKYGARGAREQDQGDLGRGFKESFQQVPQMAAGVAAGLGAYGEKLFGEGGLSTALKNTGIKNYREIEQDISRDSKPSDSLTEAYNMARSGDAGALVDWLQHGLGYVGGQGLQALATAGIGSIAGKMMLRPAAETLAQKMIAKESARLAATGIAGDQLKRQAVSNVAGKIGQIAALGTAATAMEGGEIHGDLVSQAEQEGRALSGKDLAIAFATTLGAGALEFVGDKLGLDLILGRSVASRLANSRLGNATISGTAGAVVEAGTEAAQTPLEQIGKGQDPRSPESIKETVDSAALGGLGGAALGAGGGLARRPEGDELQVTDRTPPERKALPAPPIYGEGPVYTPTGPVEAVVPGKGRLAGLGPGTVEQYDGEVMPDMGARRLTQAPQPGEYRNGTVYGGGDVVDVSPLPDITPVTKASSLDEAIANAVGVVQGATETAQARAAEFARMTAKAKNETDALLANAPEKRTAFTVPTLPGPEAQPPTLLNQPSPIVPGQAFTPRSEPIDDPRARLAEERARMVAQREQQRLTQQANPVSAPVDPARSVQPAEEGLLPSQLDLAYPSSNQVRDLIHEKGLHLDTPVFKEILRQVVKKESFADLTPQELQRLADRIQTIKAPQQPAQAQEAPPQVPLTPAKKPEKPYAPVTTIPEAQVPRSELTSEKNAEVLLRAEKAKADMEIAGTERGGRFFQEQPGTGSTQEVTGMKSATADWYRELTSGPSPAIRGDRKQSAREKIEVAIAKIIKDQGADRGKAVEQVKAALLKDQEFHRTEWGRDLASILEGEWPSYMQKPAQPLSNTKELQATENTQPLQNVPKRTTKENGEVYENMPNLREKSGRNAGAPNGFILSPMQGNENEEVQGNPSVDQGTAGQDERQELRSRLQGQGEDTQKAVPEMRLGEGGNASRGLQQADAGGMAVQALSSGTSQPNKVAKVPLSRTERLAQQKQKMEEKNPTPVSGFKTAKGSTYVIGKDGTTTRDKAPRPEHPGPKERGIQPVSETTFYVDQKGLDALGEFQAQGGPRTRVVVRGDKAALQYIEGKDEGKFEARTVTDIKKSPEVGLFPVELWKDGSRVHFGNVITEVYTTKPEPSPSNAPEMETQPATASPERAPAQPTSEAAPKTQEPEGEPFSLTAPEPSKAKAKETGPEQMSIDVPPPTSGERPIIGREATLEEAPLFSKNAQTPDAEQTTLSEHVENTQDHPMITKQDSGSSAPSPTDILASALRQAADQIQGKPASTGAIQDSSLMATTGANARMVVMEKPAEEDSAPDLPTPSIRQMGIPSATEPVIFSYRGNEQVKLHTDYADAKSGDVTAAVRLVQKLVNPETLEAVAERFRGAVFVAPMAQEASGRNAIPQALAAHYASAASGSLDTQIVQVNQPRHTGADPMQRIITRAQFDGPVRAGQRHVLVDDNLTLGGTLADLSDYIQRNGGDVAGIVVLTNANRSDTLHARPKQIRTIEERFGDVLRAQLAIDPQALTGPEAGYLIGLRDADALSNRAAKANRDREQRLSAKSLSRPEDSALAESEPSSPENDSVQQETEQSPSSFLNDERGSIPASWFTRDKTATGAIDPPVARERLNASKASLRPYLLGALGLEQLSQVYGKDHAEVRQYNKATQDMEADFTEMSRDSDKVARAWTDLNIPVADKMAKVMEDARFLNFDPDPKKNQEADSVKKQELVKRFDQLPDDAKAVYRMARDFYTNMAEQRFQALKERIERAGGTPENTRKLVDRLQLAYEKVRSKVYFPFTRFGENIVVAKQMKDGKEVDREVHAFESVAEAQKFATMMKLKGWTVKQTVAREYSVDKEGPASKIVRQMHDIIKELGQGQQGLPGVMDLENQLLDSLNQSFLQALPDMSYAKHFIHAKDVKGASRDALRSFAHSALHGAHHISRIRHADKVTQALMGLDEKINETTEGDTTEARQVYNELVKRHNDIMNPNTHPVSAWLGQLGFTMSLGGVVATGITNATQVPLVTYPWLGARYGFGKASAALARAYKDFLNPRTLNKDSLFDASKSKLISESERKMLMELARRGRIDLTQTMDLAGLSSQDNLSRKAKLTGTLNEKVTRMLGFTFHAPEVMNRQVTALSTFRLEKEKGGSFEDALQRAEQAIIDTHFIYESWNRPRYMSGNFLRVLTMFRQYSQNIAYTYGRAAAIWLDRNGATKEERTVAKRQLISMLALQFGAAGALGMPFFGSAADILMAVVGAFGDDDDKRAWEVALRKWLDGTATSLAEAFIDDKEKAGEVGKKLAEVVSHGGSRLTPWDMAGRLGQNDLFFREPQREREGRQAVMDWMLALGGPVPSYGVNFLLGMGDVAKGVTELNAGFFMRGVEELTPAVLRNGVKSLRYTLEGVRTRDEYKQLDLDTSEKLGQIFGFTPARVAEMYESTTAVKNKEHRILNEQKSLKNRFARAVDDQDDAAKQRILEDIRGFNERNPIFAITSNTLNRSLKARRQREAGMERGMYLPPRRRALLDEGDFGDF